MKSILIIVAVLILSYIATGSTTNAVQNSSDSTAVPLITTESANVKPNSTTIVTTVKPNAATTVTTVKPNATTTTVKPNTTTTVKPNTTTTVQPNTTTVQPNTTTVQPNTTTVQPNTTTVQPNTTTVQPNTTTVIPSTTHIPTPKHMDEYIVNGTNGVCIVMRTEISYKYANKNITEAGSIFSNATYSGNCSTTDIELSIHTTKVDLSLTFSKTSGQKFLKKIVLSLLNNNLTDSKDNMTELQMKNDEFFSCKSSKQINFDHSFITFTNLTLDIFRNSTNTTYLGTRHLCQEDRTTSSIVPIAVGAALAGLVITVLIAYLIGRKRSRRGYESV